MSLATAANLGITTPVQYLTGIQAEKINAKKQADAENRYGKNSVINFSPQGYSSIRGILAEKGHNNDPERILLFQFNPEIVTDVKSNNWETKSYLGFTSNDYIWGSGGERAISFKLNFEANAGANTPQFNRSRNTNTVWGGTTHETLEEFFPNGTLDDVELLQSFLYPKLESATAPRFSNGGYVPTPKFTPPPIVIFAYGNYYLEGIVADVSTEHQMWNAKLIPLRTECTVTFKVLEAQQIKVQNIIASKGGNNSSNIARDPSVPSVNGVAT